MRAVDVIKTLATLSSVSMALSPTPSIYRRYKAQDTGEYQILPLLAMFGNFLLWLIYALFVDDIFPLGIASAINCLLGLCYSIVFLLSTRDRAPAIKRVIIVFTATVLLVLYAVLAWTGHTNQSRADAGDVFGYIVAASAIAFYLSPLAKLRTVLRTKSAGTIPIAMVAVGTLNNALWLTYAIMVDDHFLIAPNVVCVTFNTFQVLLYLKYNPKRSLKTPADGRDEIVLVSVAMDGYLSSSTLQSPSFHALSSPKVFPQRRP